MTEKLRERLFELLGADRWVEGAYPIVEPTCTAEVCRLLQGYPGPVVVVGDGSNFPPDYNPGSETIVLLTRKLRQCIDISNDDQVLTVSAGWLAEDVNRVLAEHNFIVPAVARFSKGSIGGRLASISSCPVIGHDDGWIQSLLGLDVVLPSGEILELGSRCIKDVAGYDMRYLFTGSHGAAGVIVCATFRCRSSSSFQYDQKEIKTQNGKQHIPTASRYDPSWKRLFDTLGRMHPGP